MRKRYTYLKMKGFDDFYQSKKKLYKKDKSSIEQLINKALNFHSQGNISEAIKYYQYCINQGIEDHIVCSNYGIILQNQEKKQEAEKLYRKAIEHNPNFANAYSNLGTVLRDLGKLEEAEIVTRKAIELNPNFADAHSNMGGILRDLGKLKEAEIVIRKAIELNPNFVNAYFNLGAILTDLGKYQEAFDSYQRVIDINPKFSNIYSSIIELLKKSDLTHLNKIELRKLLTSLLEKNDISHKELFKPFHFLYSNGIINNLDVIDPDFLKNEFIFNEKLFINALKKIIFLDLKLEAQLVKIRKKICDLIAINKFISTHSALEFLIALGEQCFLNEYIYSISEEEQVSLQTIIKRCQDSELSESNIAILSCYYPLYKLLDQIPTLTSFNSSNQSLKELIELQITEPLKEIELSKNIKRLGKINNEISLRVQSQYEKNPYPRWRYGNHTENQKINIVQAINNQIKPNYISHKFGDEQLKVLIAGCGTGNQILQTKMYNNAQITAIDLSSSSLAYAQRKINELEIDNVELIQMDILEVELLKEEYDIIECGGVLHHMNNPSQGLKSLLSVLKQNGFLKLALYSELAREDIVKAKNYITSKQLQPNEVDIRIFREKVISGELTNLKSLETLNDFYSLSECRDLCFHAQEHRFTIGQLAETLKSNELKFLGFLLPQQIKSLYKKYFSEDKTQTNLQNWAKFEEIYPNTFTAMYQFWVSKI